jgi:hypothetical protein
MRIISFQNAIILCFVLTVAACGTAPVVAPTPFPSAPTAAGMNHGDHGGATASQPYDALFIDSMIVHHEGAITMARQALQSADRPEIRRMAEEIIAAQQAEIERMRAWRAAWYLPTSRPPAGMTMDMGPMEVAPGEDPVRPAVPGSNDPASRRRGCDGARCIAEGGAPRDRRTGRALSSQRRKPRSRRCVSGSKNGMASNREPLTWIAGINPSGACREACGWKGGEHADRAWHFQGV